MQLPMRARHKVPVHFLQGLQPAYVHHEAQAVQQQQLQAQASGLSGPQGSGFSGEREQETNGRAHCDSPTQMQGSVAPSTPVPSASMPYMQVGHICCTPACEPVLWTVWQDCGRNSMQDSMNERDLVPSNTARWTDVDDLVHAMRSSVQDGHYKSKGSLAGAPPDEQPLQQDCYLLPVQMSTPPAATSFGAYVPPGSPPGSSSGHVQGQQRFTSVPTTPERMLSPRDSTGDRPSASAVQSWSAAVAGSHTDNNMGPVWICTAWLAWLCSHMLLQCLCRIL